MFRSWSVEVVIRSQISEMSESGVGFKYIEKSKSKSPELGVRFWSRSRLGLEVGVGSQS